MKPYDNYEIHGIAEFTNGSTRCCEPVADDEAQFWSLYGHVPGEGVECIGDFKTRRDAEHVRDRITGGNHVTRLLGALDLLLEQTVDMDLKYGLTLSEGEAEARDKALAAIAAVTGS